MTIDANRKVFRGVVEGVAGTPAVLLLRSVKAPRAISLAESPLSDWRWDESHGLVRIRFENTSAPRELVVTF